MGSTRKGRDIHAALRKKGFQYDSTGDHVYYFFGETSVRTKMSHGMMGMSVGAPLLSQMARQLHLTNSQFLDLIDCSMDEGGYLAILLEQGFDLA